MKKVLFALVAVFAMSSVAFAQDAVEMSFENNVLKVTVNNHDFNFNKADFEAMETIGDMDLASLKDVSFPTENVGALSTVSLDKVKGGDRVVGAILAIFLGDFGIHHFYTGDTKDGILHLCFFWCGIPALIGFIEGIIWLVDESSFPQPLFGGII